MAITTPPRATALGVLVAAGTGVLTVLAFPPVGVWPLVVLVPVPLLVAQHALLPPRRSWLAPAVGLATFVAAHFSLGLRDGEVGVVYQLFPLYAGAVAGGLGRRSRDRHARTGHRWFLVAGPLLWVALDFLRSSASETFGGTFAFPAYALWDHPLLLQPVSVLGIHALDLLLFSAGWVVAGAVLVRLGVSVPHVRRGAAVVAALTLAWVGTSVALMDDAPRTLRVAAIQTGVARGPDDWEERYRRDVEQTREAARQGAQLVVWNEVGLQLDPGVERTDELRALALETGVHLAIGYGFEDDQGRRHNEVLLLAPDGEILGTYGKDHPGSFAGDYSDTGGTYPVYDTELGTIATIICYDLDFTDTARKMARGGAQVIATPSADVPSLAYTHFTHLVFRAIENRVAMVKADNEFDSAVIDPWGRVVAKATSYDGGLQATLVADVPLGAADSPWVRYGDWFGWVTVVAAATVGARLRLASRKSAQMEIP
jgi:apolipoprotein N-acyltransferase